MLLLSAVAVVVVVIVVTVVAAAAAVAILIIAALRECDLSPSQRTLAIVEFNGGESGGVVAVPCACLVRFGMSLSLAWRKYNEI